MSSNFQKVGGTRAHSLEIYNDYSIHVESTRALQCMNIHTLVIDCDGRQRNNSHFTIEESVATAKLLRAKKVCHSSITFPQ